MRTNLEIILGEWGRWQVAQDDSHQGYPSHAAFTCLKVDGVRRRSDPYAPLLDDDVRRLNGAILRLHPQYRSVVLAHYKWPGPVKIKLDRLGLSRTGYFDTLKFCHMQLSHEMGGRYIKGYDDKSSGLIEALSGQI